MFDQESESFRELCLYFIGSEQWSEAYELHQQVHGSSPAAAQTAIHELAARYGYARRHESASATWLAACGMMTCLLILAMKFAV